MLIPADDPNQLPVPVTASRGALLTREDFRRLRNVPPEAEWFANIDNPRTRRAYRGLRRAISRAEKLMVATQRGH